MGPKGGPPPGRAPPWRDQGGGRATWPPGPGGHPSGSPLAFIYLSSRKPSRGSPSRDFIYYSAAAAILVLGSLEEPVPAPCRREDCPPEAPPPPWSPPRCVVSSPPWSMGPWPVAMWCLLSNLVLQCLALVSYLSWLRHLCISSCFAMLCLLGSDGLWDYVQFVMSNIFGLPLYFFLE